MMSLMFFVLLFFLSYFLDRSQSQSLISLPSDIIKENYQLKCDRQRPPERIFVKY